MGTMDFDKCSSQTKNQFKAESKRWLKAQEKVEHQPVSKGPRHQPNKQKKRK